VRPLLAERGCAVPDRPGVRLKTLAGVFAYAEAEGITLRIDGTEVPVRRPQANRPGRKAFVSGKKKQNTEKATMISDGQGRLLWLGAIRPGRMHDVTQVCTQGVEEQLRLHPRVKAEVGSEPPGRHLQIPIVQLPVSLVGCRQGVRCNAVVRDCVSTASGHAEQAAPGGERVAVLARGARAWRASSLPLPSAAEGREIYSQIARTAGSRRGSSGMPLHGAEKISSRTPINGARSHRSGAEYALVGGVWPSSYA
jgi:hypothetical protein